MQYCEFDSKFTNGTYVDLKTTIVDSFLFDLNPGIDYVLFMREVVGDLVKGPFSRISTKKLSIYPKISGNLDILQDKDRLSVSISNPRINDGGSETQFQIEIMDVLKTNVLKVLTRTLPYFLSNTELDTLTFGQKYIANVSVKNEMWESASPLTTNFIRNKNSEITEFGIKNGYHCKLDAIA